MSSEVVRAIAVGALAIVAASSSSGEARGQGLGGYGSMAMGGPGVPGMGGAIIPYAGKFGGFMPSRTGGGGDLAFTPRGGSAMGGPRTSFSLSPAGGGMSPMSGGTVLGVRSPLAPMGIGGMPRSSPRPGGMGVMPPNFGYPFRQPPPLVAPAGAASGMSM